MNTRVPSTNAEPTFEQPRQHITARHGGRGWLLLTLLLLASPRWARATPPGVATENVRFESAGVTLAGTVFTPRQSVAAVVLVHGSGPEKRMTELATRLAEEGLAVLTYDKRGAGESGGVYAGPEVGTNNIDAANLRLLAADASAATTALLAHLPARHGPVGLLGFSQAGWVIPLAANLNRAVRFLVLFSGPVITAREQLRFQFFTDGKRDFWATHTEAEAREHLRHDPDRYSFTDTDARAALATLDIPGLWLFGGQDIQVPVHLSMEHLDALKAQGKPYEYRLFPALGHNTAFEASPEPFGRALQWMKALAKHPQRKRG
ncbi:alpha/beta hydrolase [Hymenobacter sp. M29]|uniref:Alpha/beta hydrolase n=1 Tax=Hymenobacter mellowenesis TaxID=3063995 RepID=A0ABT9AE23_9BACT|nr:alpha/beta hydrolase [Hymenobacter sp. M29]MDO7848100.1 alpha/beta hydrolase [Hymenobacter sp. M29]